MSLLAGLGLGNLFDKEAATKEIVQSSLKDVAEELGVSYKDLFFMIVPVNDNFDHKYFVCKWGDNNLPVKVREITLKEILGEQEEE